MTIDAKNTTDRVEHEALAFCEKHALFPRGAYVIAAFSGGADSTALLLFLLRCRKTLGITVAAAHVDHGIRGEDSRRDAAFAQDFCQKNDIPFFLCDAVREGVTVPVHPTEEWARKLRYDYLGRLAASRGALIATAHTASDQLETLLLRTARGTGLHGMAGIPPVRGVFRRPFLTLTRADTEAYCAALGQNYVLDATNNTDMYARNRIRHNAVPALLTINPSAERSAARLCEQLRAVDEWLGAEADALLQKAACGQRQYRLCVLRAAPPPVLDAALHRLVAAARGAEEKYVALLRALVQNGTGAVQLTDAVCFCIEKDCLTQCPKTPALPQVSPPQAIKIGKYALSGGYFVEFQRIKYEDFLKSELFFKKDLNCCADCAKIDKNTVLRTRRAGDVYRPVGRGLHKTLKKLYNERGIPCAERSLLPLLANGSEVLWLWGFGFAEGYAPTGSAKEVLVVRTEKSEGN